MEFFFVKFEILFCTKKSGRGFVVLWPAFLCIFWHWSVKSCKSYLITTFFYLIYCQFACPMSKKRNFFSNFSTNFFFYFFLIDYCLLNLRSFFFVFSWKKIFYSFFCIFSGFFDWSTTKPFNKPPTRHLDWNTECWNYEFQTKKKVVKSWKICEKWITAGDKV